MRTHCSECKHHWSWKLNDGRRKCRSYGHRYTSQNIWDACRLPEKVKRKLLEYFVLGVPAYRLRHWNLASRAILCLVEQCEPMLEGIIECDEASFGGKRKGRRGWDAAGKIVVFGMMKRNGKVKVMPVPSRETETLIPLIQEHTRPGSL